MRYKNIICKYCGEKASVPTLRKQNYCDKPNCKMLAHNEVARKHYHSNKSDNQTNNDFYQTKIFDDSIQQKPNINQNNQQKAVAQRVVSQKVADNLYVDDIMDIALEMGKSRYKLIQLIQKLVKEEKGYNKQDDIILHKLEFEDLSKEETEKLVNQLIGDRPNRRTIKVRRQIVNWLLVNSPIKNPTAFVKAAVKGVATSRQFGEYLDGLTNDPNIFAKQISSNKTQKRGE